MSADRDNEGWPPPSIACGLIVAAVAIAYSNSLEYPFLFDGIPLAAGLRTLSLTDPVGWLLPRPRTVGYLTFDLQNTLHGLWLPGFHAVNIGIHAAAACLLFLLVRGVTMPRLGPARAAAVGLFTALPVFLLFDRAFLAPSWREVLARRGWYYGGLLAAVGAGVIYVLLNRSHYLAGGLLCAQRVSTWQYLRTQPEIIGHYLHKALWPAGLSVDPAWPLQDDPLLLASEWAIAGLALLGIAALYRRRPELGFLPITAILILLPTSSIAPIIDLAYEHRVYLSLAPLATALALAIGRGSVAGLVAPAGSSSGMLRTVPASIRAVVLTVVIGALALATSGRNAVHADAVSLWRDTAAKSPHNMRALCNLGLAFEERGDAESAAACYREAISIYRATRGQGRHPQADPARRTPRTAEYAWCAYARLARLELDRGDRAAAADLFEELAWLPFLPAREDFRGWIEALKRDLEATGGF